MGFFFATNQREPRAKKKANAGPRQVTAKTKQSAGTLTRLGCKACPLADKGERLHPYIPDRADVFILGEKPGAAKDDIIKPWAGEDGQLLKELIPAKYRKRCAVGFTVQHRPKDSPSWHEIECCRGHVTKAIERAAPKLIIGLGPAALQWVLGSADQIGLRGRLFAVQIGSHKCWFFPTFDPTFVRKQAYQADKPLNSRYGHAFRMDMTRAFQYLKMPDKPLIISSVEAKEDVQIYGPRNFLGFDELLDEFKHAIKSRKVAIDLETYPLRPYKRDSELLSASITYRQKLRDGGTKLKTFAFAVNHPQSAWTKKQKEIILDCLLELLSDNRVIKIAHNAPFELEWLIAQFGIEWVDHKSWEDTMMQAHLLDERKGPGKEEDNRPTYQSLDFLVKQHFGLPLKSMFKLNKKDMRKTDLEECLVYNGCDTKFTYLLHERQETLLKEEGLLKTFHFSKPRQATVALMQHFGVDVDQGANKRWSDKLANEVATIEAEIKEMKVVKKYAADKGGFNPHSVDDVVGVFRDYLKRKEIRVPGKRAGDPERISVDKGTLSQIDHPLAPAIIKLRNRQKLKSTYVDEFTAGTGSIIYDDGKLHTSYNTTFTTSGRLSSDGPNLQNFPKREDKEVREQVVPPKGHVIVSVDYGQLEWCLGCICSKDKAMIDATWKGYDVHMEWATKIARIWPELVGGKKNIKDKDKMKKARGLVKNKMVFPVIFGATQESVAGYLSMPDRVAKEVFEEFWATFTGLDKWQRKLMKDYYENGYVENLFGRRRRYPMTKNEAINHPIQSTASDIVVEAMNRLSIRALESDVMYLHPRLNIHDDLTFFVPDKGSVLDDAISIIVEEMLALPYEFINVPMSVEVSIGPNWSDQEEIGKFWTTDLYGKNHERHISTQK